MKTPNFEKAKREAVFLLSLQEHTFCLAVDIKTLKYDKPVIIDSLEQYAWITGIDQDFEASCQLYDGLKHGCTIRAVDGMNLVLYDGHARNKRRQNWSLAHEIGHIYMQHDNDGPVEEVEANFFASQLLCPDIVVYQLLKSGIHVTENYLHDHFFLSKEAARKKMQYLKSAVHTQPSPVEETVIQVFSQAVSREATIFKLKNSKGRL